MIRTDPPITGKAFTTLEKIPTKVCMNNLEGAERVAVIIAEAIRANRRQDKPTVLGLATGHTPIGVYRELIRMHREEGLDFSQVITFNLDEYYPIPPDSTQSYRRWMQENLFDYINIPAENIHIPDGTIPEDQVLAYCQEYESRIKAAGGIDIQLLGIGMTGHIGFNEPGSSPDSVTRVIDLDPTTRRSAAADFFGVENVPRQAITMGLATILQAKKILLLAFGEQKAPIIRKTVEGPVTDSVPASYLQKHDHAEVIAGIAAAADLTRVANPWVLGEIDWTEENRHRALIWLSLETGKSLLKLDQYDYDTHNLAALARQVNSVDVLNRKVYNRLSQTIVQHENLPQDKKVLCFSPHPDDDVISMGATINRLIQQGSEVHVAYMTSGNIAVFDDYTRRILELWAELNRVFDCSGKIEQSLEQKVSDFLSSKTPGAADIPEVQEIKTQIRRSEALAASGHMGVNRKNAHFLDLPFYKTGEVHKHPLSDEDIEIVLNLIQDIRPNWIFVAGELSDPHGTHRLCAEAIYEALKRCPQEQRPETIWLYRGAWQEWDPDVIDMAIPLSKSELTYKIFGIFKHESQKDKALFPGPYDDREFWQRAEARNTETAAAYNKLGLPEYHAMEAFVRYQGP